MINFKDLLSSVAHASGGPSSISSNTIWLGIVASIKDELGVNRIKVHVLGLDDIGKPGISEIDRIDALPWSFSILPSHLAITPKVGELVIVLLSNPKIPVAGRFWIGPIYGTGITEESALETMARLGL